jgi:phenylalanyl-tRNA synthetase alpha chain
MADLLAQLEELARSAREHIPAAADEKGLEELRVRYLGKKGELSAALRGMGELPAGERPRVGEVANRVRDEIEGLLKTRSRGLESARMERELSGPPLDVTLPGRRLLPRGHRHPVSRTLEDIVGIFARLGYETTHGPEIELDHYNFEALNFPPDHPARDMQDTFFVEQAGAGDLLLRTHTSPVQVREMLQRKPPVRIVCPGKVYRCDSDQTHSPMFHQVEGLCVDAGITFANLKGTLAAFNKAFFGAGTKTRFRPSYFPFVEPGAEVDVSCVMCGGSGVRPSGRGEPVESRERCGACKGSGWMEVLGAGMVHPAVLEAAGYDPAKVTGFAFGLGVERLAMLRYGIGDLRMFFENDGRFLEQFP